jgi:hypothetical protein
LGQKRTYAPQKAMSALPPIATVKADIRIRSCLLDPESLEVDHAPVTEVGPNDDFGLKVIAHAREHDAVFKVRS